MIDRRFLASRPEEVGIDPDRLEAVFARAQRDVDAGVLPSAQVAVARHGKIAGMRTIGHAVQGGVHQRATDDTLYCIFSATKGVVGAAIWVLIEEGALGVHERVADIIPEFGSNGKDVITVEQVLLHVGGFPYAPYHPDDWDDRDKLLATLARWRLSWEPGSRYEYHPTSAHWVLSELIHRRAGTDYRRFVRERLTGPLGLDELFIGLPAAHDGRVAEVCYTSEPVPPPGGWGEVTPEAILQFNRPELRRVGIPGGGGVTGAAELALFYQALLNGGVGQDGARVLREDTIELGTVVRTAAHHRDPIWDVPANRGLSVVVAGDDGNAHIRGFGRSASPRAFGHNGAGGQVAWGDPATGISVGYCTNGFADWMTSARRVTAISSLAAQCVVA